MKSIQVTDEQYEMMKELSNLRKTQDNRATRDPIWLVQTERSRVCNEEYTYGEKTAWVIVDEGGNELCSSLWSMENNIEGVKNHIDGEDLLEELKDEVKQIEALNEVDDIWNIVESLPDLDLRYVCIEYYYETIATFLTDQEAKAYIKYQSHNLTNPRTYVDYVGYSNRGYLPKLMNMLLDLKFGGEKNDRS